MATVLSNITFENENFEIYSLIWLDALVNSSQENRRAQKQLRTSINHLLSFEDDQLCFDYLKSREKDDRIIFIVSGQFGQTFIPKIVHFRHIIAIYVYCFNKDFHQQWAKNYSKIKGVQTKLDIIINQIKSDQNQRQHSKISEALSIKIFNSNTKIEGQSTTSDLDGQFLHSQILIECLIKIKLNSRDEKELISLCKQYYEGNEYDLNIVKEFQTNYLPEKSIWWYTRESFLYRILNKALRTQNIDLLYLFRFFIYDIEQQLEENKCKNPVRVYRSQLMSKDEVRILKTSIGKIISINSFLSTSSNAERARCFFSCVDLSDDYEKVFFQINADPRIDNIKAFSNITSLSYYSNEEEILFMIGSIFKLNNVLQDTDGIWIIQMSLCSFDDEQLQALFQHMKNQLGKEETNLLKFTQILKDMGKLEEAEKYIFRLLNQLSKDHKDIASCYFQLGGIARCKSDYDLSLEWLNKSLQIRMQTLESDDPIITSNYNAIAMVYRKKDDCKRALEAYNKALVIYRKVYDENHPTVALCYNNIGNIYKKEKKYSEALVSYQKSLSIREKCLPAIHSHIGSSHNNIGTLQHILRKNDLALEHLYKALKIYNKALPSQHPDIAIVLRNIGVVYEDKNDLKQALFYFKKAADIYRQLFIPTNFDVIQIENDIQRILNRQEELI
ncbi:unnamed protein product [Adineta steineri]|uniref:Uncharacterized protein n=1 Tax=Adineta steineri TaxID=433720 RepID=A0A816AYR3_9BILA|nr:unnamed protein product [Adineta steineri]CAF1603238.1 unnamed protein product [Adineta steineri]